MIMHFHNKKQLVEFLQQDVLDDDEPLFLVQADVLLYPQYDVHEMFANWVQETIVQRWLIKTAVKNLLGSGGVKEVRDHWKAIAGRIGEL